MVMYVYIKNKAEPVGQVYVGQPVCVEKPKGLGITPDQIREIYVDGQELTRAAAILRRPDIKSRSLVLYGKEAQTVAEYWI